MRLLTLLTLTLLNLAIAESYTDVEEMHDIETIYAIDYHYECREGVMFYHDHTDPTFSFAPLFDESGEVIYCDDEARFKKRLLTIKTDPLSDEVSE